MGYFSTLIVGICIDPKYFDNGSQVFRVPRCEIVWTYLVFSELYVNQSLLIAEIYQHSITTTTLTWLRPPRPSHGLRYRYEIVWIYLVFCVLYVNQSADCRDMSTLYYINHTVTMIEWKQGLIILHKTKKSYADLMFPPVIS